MASAAKELHPGKGEAAGKLPKGDDDAGHLRTSHEVAPVESAGACMYEGACGSRASWLKSSPGVVGTASDHLQPPPSLQEPAKAHEAATQLQYVSCVCVRSPSSESSDRRVRLEATSGIERGGQSAARRTRNETQCHCADVLHTKPLTLAEPKHGKATLSESAAEVSA